MGLNFSNEDFSGNSMDDNDRDLTMQRTEKKLRDELFAIPLTIHSIHDCQACAP